MNRRTNLLALLFLGAIGCGPPWAVLQQSGPPSALAGAPQVSVEFDFSQLVLDGQPVAQSLAAESPDEVATIEGVFMEMQSGFIAEMGARSPIPVFAAQAPPVQGEVRARVVYTWIQRGPRGPIGFSNTEVTARIEWSVGGQVTDAIELMRSQSASLTRPSVARRIAVCNTQIARLTADFIAREQRR